MASSKQTLLGARIAAGFDTQQELATAAKLARSTIQLAEKGGPISQKSAYKIIQALKSRGMNIEIGDLNWSLIE